MAPKLTHSPYLVSVEEMLRLEQASLSEDREMVDLMEDAGTQVAEVIAQICSAEEGSEDRIVILCGPGNNGGDGFVCAKVLKKKGWQVDLILASSEKYSAELTAQMRAFVADNQDFFIYSDATGELSLNERVMHPQELVSQLLSTSVVVDALLGLKQTGEPRGAVKGMVDCIRRAKADPQAVFRVFSIDIPTGVNADTGAVAESHVPADYTIVIQHLKRGMSQYPARDALGQLRIVDVGMSAKDLDSQFQLVEGDEKWLQLPGRNPAAHKGDFGHVLVIAGSLSMPGAPILTSGAALRSGAGLVTRAAFHAAVDVSVYPEVLFEVFPGALDMSCTARLGRKMEEVSACVLGPGLGSSSDTQQAVLQLVRILTEKNRACVIDADGLNALAPFTAQGQRFGIQNAVFTPHPGEAARLLGLTTAQVQADRFTAVIELQKRLGGTVVLKGAGSVVWDGEHGYVISRGGPFLATPGSGDVLSGMIATFLASGTPPLLAAIRGATFHAIAGELAFLKNQGLIIASDVINAIPQAIQAPSAPEVVSN